MRYIALFWLALLVQLSCAAPGFSASKDAGRQLEQVQRRLQDMERDLRRQARARDRAQNELRDAEMAEAGARRSLAGARRELAAARERLAALERDAEAARAALAAERARLEAQLRLAYINGNQEWLRLVLSQADPSAVGRQLVYYGYLARQRGELMQVARTRAAALAEAVAQVAREQERFAALEVQEAARVAELAAARSGRADVLARLDRDLATGRDRAERLRGQARELERVVAELARAMASLPPDTEFGGRKGELRWPADGTPTNRFGQARADGQLKWEGVVLAAAAGTEVRAIHDGVLVFADWLPGLGLLAVLDHGDGYLSLYGHNQDLTRSAGEQVRAGELLGHVGDTGGLARSGLYFEIRKNGRPVDPVAWMRR